GTRWRSSANAGALPTTDRDWEIAGLSDQVNEAGSWGIPELQAVRDRLLGEAAVEKSIRRHLQKSCDLRQDYQQLQKWAKVAGIGVKGEGRGTTYREPRPVWSCPTCAEFALTFGRKHQHARACPLAGHPTPMLHVTVQVGLIQASRNTVHRPVREGTGT